MSLTYAITSFRCFLFRFLDFKIAREVALVFCLYLMALPMMADDLAGQNTVKDSESQNAQALVHNKLKSNSRLYPLTKRENPWGAFLPGTWVVRRTNSQRYSGSVANSVTDTYLTLEEVNDNSLTLRKETIIGLVAGAVAPTPIRQTFDFYQQPLFENVEIEQLQPQTLVIARRQIVCQVCRYTQISDDQKKTTTIWYSNTVLPYLLRSEEIRTNNPDSPDQVETVLSHTIMTVTDTSGVRLFKNILNEYKTQTIKKTAAGTTVSQASFSENIPGGLLHEVTVETDPVGKILARNVTSVCDYFVASSGTPTRRYRSQREASQEIKSNWENITRFDD